MRFGICASYQQVATLKHIPFDYLEESVQRFLIPEQPEEEFAQQLLEARRLPVPIESANVLLPANMPLVATPEQQVDLPRLERYIKTTLRRAEQAGIRVIVFGSGRARACPASYDQQDALRQIAEHLARWSTWARGYGVQFALEPLRYEETNTLNTVTECGELVSRIADTGAKLLADTYHMASNGEDPATVVPWSALLAHVHVAELQDRAAPGTHGYDFHPYFSALRRAGYDGRISIECNWRDLATEVDSALATLRAQWDSSVQS